MVFHVLNRSGGPLKLFNNDKEFAAFDEAIARTLASCPMRICAYTLMPDHWHFLLWPEHKGDLSAFLQKLTITHVRNWQENRDRVGLGNVYQGRYRSFPVEAGSSEGGPSSAGGESEYFYGVARYIEQNSLRTGLVKKADEWRWCSLWRRVHGTAAERKVLGAWPVKMPPNWRKLANTLQNADELGAVRQSVRRGRPYGSDNWAIPTAARLGLESSFRPRGRPRKVADAAAKEKTAESPVKKKPTKKPGKKKLAKKKLARSKIAKRTPIKKKPSKKVSSVLKKKTASKK
jgi:putative transposase